MRKFAFLLSFIIICTALLTGCSSESPAQIAATTLPVYEFTTNLCKGTEITVTRLVTEEVSCLHDYTLQTGQMRAIEAAELIVISGGGLEDFLEDAIGNKAVIDASSGMELHSGHQHEGHSHENDPHIWLSPEEAKHMVQNIAHQLSEQYPQYTDIFHQNEAALLEKLDALHSYASEQLKELSCRELITFHDGFTYLAESYDLTILKAVEEESGSEASAQELIQLIQLVQDHQLPAIFTEKSGSVSAAGIISRETQVQIYTLDMAMSGDSYFDAMYHNIDTLKEALG